MSPFEIEMEIEFNSAFDYVAEAFGATGRDANEMAESDRLEELRLEAEFIGPRQPFAFDDLPF
jgi:hypothetical protein